MDIQKEREAFEKLIDIEIIISEGFKFNPNINQYYHPDHTNHRLSYAYLMGAWMVWQEKAQAVPEGRTDFEIINQTIELVDLLALSTNAFQRDPKSKVHPFESENPRVMEWWRTACQIQELLTNTDPDNCDFEEYKAMIEALELNRE